MFICIKQWTTSLISLYEATNLLLSAKQNIFNLEIVFENFHNNLDLIGIYFILDSSQLIYIAIAYMLCVHLNVFVH